MILELKGVYKEYTRGKMAVPVLKDISMQVEDGSYIAIMGPSGSGKTTLMNLIGCLDVPTSGQVLIDGVDISTQNDDQMAKLRNTFIGFVFQHFHLLQEKCGAASFICGRAGQRETRQGRGSTQEGGTGGASSF